VDADGFAASARAASPPRDRAARRVLAGTSALHHAGDDPATPGDQAPVAQHVGFTPCAAAPTTRIIACLGVFSSRLPGRCARRRSSVPRRAAAYDAQRARHDPPDVRTRATTALQPCLARTQPVVMQADSKREIERALDLAEEFTCGAMIAGARGPPGGRARLKAENVPVLLLGQLPRRPQQAQSADADPGAAARAARARRGAASGRGAWREAGVRFAFQSGGLANGAELLGQRAARRGDGCRPTRRCAR
jgi:hypothetical protein